ncbi:hypothetical protein QW131_21835 [Roseibium salinum]|nr:hypothetical protein [Roseibium salinum]
MPEREEVAKIIDETVDMFLARYGVSATAKNAAE